MKQIKRIFSLMLTLVMLLSLQPMEAWAAGSTEIETDSVISVESASTNPGGTVEVKLKIANNPGILGMTLSVTYDEELASLIDIQNGDALSYMTFTAPREFYSGVQLPWDALDVDPDAVRDGVIATLTFQLADTTKAGDIVNIGVSYQPGAIINNDMEPIHIGMNAGYIKVIDYIPGDVNGDNIVNSTDVVYLRRYIAGGYGVSINEAAGDVNDDGVANTTDVVFIRRFVAGGYGVTLKPSSPRCHHTMKETAAAPATCTDDGNIAYWHCTTCGLYFRDAGGTTEIDLEDTVIAAKGHTVVIDPAVEPTFELTGLTEGSHCSVCECIIKAQEIVPVKVGTPGQVAYNCYGADSYLEGMDWDTLNPNPKSYTVERGLTLQDLSADGYTFLGWKDVYGNTVTSIPKGTSGPMTLYAQWKAIEYTVTFDSPLVPKTSIKRTIGEKWTAENLSLFGYNFVGWTNDSGVLVSSIEPGTKNVTLHANWTSKRNQTIPAAPSAPIIYEDTDAGIYLFVYELGRVENIPLYTIKELLNSNGMVYSESVTTTVSVEQGTAEAVAKSISEATTKSSSWTLSNEWNKATGFSEDHASEIGEQSMSTARSSFAATGSYSVGKSWGGSHTMTSSSEVGSKSSAKLSAGLEIGGIPFDIGGTFGAKIGSEVSEEVSTKDSVSSSVSKNWNTNKSFEVGTAVSRDVSTSSAVSKSISDRFGYSSTSSEGGGSSTTEGLVSSQTETRESTSTVTYNAGTETKTTTELSNNGSPEGYYRLVWAGVAHVFGVVGYDVASQSYFTYTYSVIDDRESKAFIDYSKNTSSFDDYENGVLPFEIPIFVNDYIDDIMCATDGLVVDAETGVIEAYTGEYENVIVPQFMSVDNGDGTRDAVKVTGISPEAFAGNTRIKSVYLGKYVTQIPDNAFAGCTALETVTCMSLTSIGNGAFSGCTSLKKYTVSENVSYLGADAFVGVSEIAVTAANASVADAAIYSGASRITVNVASMTDAFDNRTVNVTGDTEYFEFQGGERTFNGLQFVSDAGTTVINGAVLNNGAGIPLKLSSPNVTLNRVTVNTNSLAMQLSASGANVALQGTVNLNTSGNNALICKGMDLSQASSGVVGKLNVSGNVLCCGEIGGKSLLTVTNGEIIYISEEEYENTLNTHLVYLDANGGTVETGSIVVTWNSAIGAMPVPVKDYYTFDGWYTQAEGGELVTPKTVMTSLEDITLYAHWTQNAVSGWILASEVPEGAEIVGTKWSYFQTTNTDSRETSLEGYTLVGSEWIQSGSGSQNWATFPKGYDSSNSYYTNYAKSKPYTASETETAKREVTDKWAGYIYWHWMYDTAKASAGNRTIYDHKGTASYNNFYYDIFGAFTSTSGYTANGTDYSCGSYGYKTYSGTGRTSYADSQGTKYWYRFDYNTCSYIDYYKLFHYTKTEALESENDPTGGVGVSNVQQWVQYRAK